MSAWASLFNELTMRDDNKYTEVHCLNWINLKMAVERITVEKIFTRQKLRN